MARKGSEITLDILIGAKVASSVGKAASAVVASVGVITAATVKLAANCVKSAMAYDSQLQNIATLLDGTEAQVEERTQEISKDILEISNATGVVTSDLTDGMYQVVSAFGDSSDAAKQLEVSAKAAAAGNATTTDAINLLSAVTKGYGNTSAAAIQKASDLSFVTVKLGQTSFPELASSIGKVVPLASALNVSQEELYGTFATLTGVTGSTAEVATQYKAVLSGLMSPSKDMGKVLSSLGYKTGAAAIEALGFQGTLEALQKSCKGDVQATAKLFSSVEAQTAILALCGAQADTYSEKMEAMKNVTGATDRAFATQTDNLEYTMQIIKNLGENFKTEIGMMLLPMVRDIAETLLPAIQNGMNTLMPAIENIISAIDIDMIIGLVTDFLPLLFDVIEQLTPTVADLASTFISDLIPSVLPLITDVLPLVFEVLNELTPTVSQLIGAILPLAIDIIKQILPPAMQLIQAVLPVVAPLLDAIMQIITALLPAIQPIMDIVVSLIPIITNAVSALSPVLITIGELVALLINVLMPVIDFVAVAVVGTIESISGTINDIVNSIMLVFRGIIDFVTGIFSENWSQAWQGIVDTFSGIFSTLGDLVKLPINAVISVINGAINGLNSVSVTIPDWVPGLGGNTYGISIPTIPMLANGGIVTKPTLAEIGEGGESEAVIPLSRLESMMSDVAAATLTANVNASTAYQPNLSDGFSFGAFAEKIDSYAGNGTPINITYSPTYNITTDNPEEMKEAVSGDYEQFKKFMDKYLREKKRLAF